MRISVALATWNGERFLAEQLESVAKQSRLPDQLVISDDGSTDRTIEIARSFAARARFDVLILTNQQRLGFAENFFRAVRACMGDFIALCDQDDVWLPEKLARCEAPLLADSRVSIVMHSGRAVDADLRPIWAHPAHRIRSRRLARAGSARPFPVPARCGWTMMFRGAIIQAADPESRPREYPDPDMKMNHDTWIALVADALGTSVLLPDELVLYRRHSGSATEGWTGHLSGPTARTATDQVRNRVQYVRGRLKQSLDAGASDVYRERSAAARERMTYLASLRPIAERFGETARRGLERAIESHRRYARVTDRRADVFAEYRAGRRAVMLGRDFLGGDYGLRSHGGLGLSSLARDIVAIALPPNGGHEQCH